MSVILLLLAVVPGHTLGAIFYVKTNSPANGPGTAWTNAFHDIQSAVDVATNFGDIVRVTNGVYNTGGAISPGSTASPQLISRIVATNAITIESVGGPGVTTIVGQWPPGNTAVRCAFLTNNAVLSGFTLYHGCTRTTGDTRADRSGGGAYMEGGVMTNCIVNMCASYAYGGGVYGGLVLDTDLRDGYTLWGGAGVSHCTALDCNIYNNECDDSGAGAYQSTLVRCVVSTNTALDDGGGGYLCIVSNCVFRGNTATTWRGGGTYSGTACNSLYIGNHAQFEGGGIYRGNNYNCTVVGNTAGLQCGGVSDGGGGGSGWYNCIIYYNTASNIPNGVGTFEYSCSTILLGGAGSFTNPPLFVDTNDWADLKLQAGSPCRDSGTNESWMTSIVDLDDSPRIVNYRADMGCYEYVFSTNDYDGDGLSNDEETGVYFTDQTTANTDGDPMHDGDEIIAGTDPNNNASYFIINNTLANSNGHIIVEWYGVTDRVYSVCMTTNPLEAFVGIDGQSNLAGANATIQYTNTVLGSAEFYRIKVSRP